VVDAETRAVVVVTVVVATQVQCDVVVVVVVTVVVATQVPCNPVVVVSTQLVFSSISSIVLAESKPQVWISCMSGYPTKNQQ
jgi:hypothetical protein